MGGRTPAGAANGGLGGSPGGTLRRCGRRPWRSTADQRPRCPFRATDLGDPIDLRRFESASTLPSDWDDAASSYFQQREFLAFSERFNPCRLRYYAGLEEGTVRAGAIVYTLRLDLLTFLRIPSPIPMHIVSVPVGTATPGCFGETAPRRELLRRVTEAERGLLLTLNADPSEDLPAGTKCRLIPTILFENQFRDWDDYLAGLRAPHRRRIRHLETAAARLVRTVGGCATFTEAHHRLYRQVRGRAEATLEALSCDFFRHLPDRFRLSSYHLEGRLVSWTITVHDGTLFMYFFGGMDYACHRETRAYLVGLLNIVRTCIEEGHPRLDLGQTAAEPKLRFGGRVEPKAMYLTHHRPGIRFLLERLGPWLEYRGEVPAFHALKTPPESP